MKEILSGNEAIARGAYEAGVKVEPLFLKVIPFEKILDHAEKIVLADSDGHNGLTDFKDF